MKLNKKIWRDEEEFNSYMFIYANTPLHKFKNCVDPNMTISKWSSLSAVYSSNKEKYYDLVLDKGSINNSGHIPNTAFIKNWKVIYKLYTKSKYWKRKRLKRISDCNNVCQCCKYEYLESDLNLHHHTYERLWEELESDLVVVCRECHHNIHFDNWNKVPLVWSLLLHRYNKISSYVNSPLHI